MSGFPRINYVIATYSGVIPLRKEHDNESNLILRKHMKVLSQALKTTSYIKQVTIVRPSVNSGKVYPEYYNITEFIREIEKLGIVVVILSPNISFGTSYSQYLHAYTEYSNFDFYIVMEDDWVPFPRHDHFDKTLLWEYKKLNYDGFLSAWVTDLNGRFPIHSAISVGILSKNSLKQARTKVLYKGCLPKSIGQRAFSGLFRNADYSDKGKNYMIPFWETRDGVVYEYALELSSRYLLVPIQLLQPDKYRYVVHNYKSHSKTPPSNQVVQWVKSRNI